MNEQNISPEREFTPMKRSFRLIFASITLLFVFTISSGAWFSKKIGGFSKAINLAGSERMRAFQIAYLVTRSLSEKSPQREETLGHVKMEMDRFEEILNSLKNGSTKYNIADVTDKDLDKNLIQLIHRWEEEFKPKLNSLFMAAPEDRGRLTREYGKAIHDFVEVDLDGIVTQMVKKIERIEQVFINGRYLVTAIAILLMMFNLSYLRRRVLKPISTLVADTEKIIGGNYSVSVKVQAADELMVLAERFNTMTGTIARSLRDMETKVQQRTLELSTANTRMQSFFDSAADAIISINPEDRSILLFTKGAEKIFGYSSDEVIGRNVNILMPEPYHSAHETYVKNYIGTGIKKIIGQTVRVKAKKKEGDIIDVDLSVSESVTQTGRVFNAIIRDMSDRMQAEMEMQKLSNAIEQSSESVVITDYNGNIEYVNPAFERVTGYTRAEAIGKNPRILKSGHQLRSYYKELWDTILGGSIWRGEFSNKKKNGEIYYEDATITPIRNKNGEITHFVAIKNNITARKLAEADAAKKNAELEIRAHYDTIYAKAISIFNTTFDQRQAVMDMLSLLSNSLPYPSMAFYTYDEWAGKLICESAYGISGSMRKEFELSEGIVGQSVLSGQAIEIKGSVQFPLTIETGLLSITPQAVIVQPVFYQGKVMGVLVIASVTQLSDLDRGFIERLSINIGISLQNLRQYNDMKELSEQIKLRGSEIAQKNIQLEESNRLKSEFLANMSHELRTPLNAIIGFSEILKDGILGDLGEGQKEYVVDIFTSGQHLLSLINDILDLSKIEAGKMSLDLDRLDIPYMLGNSLSIIKEKAQANSIALKLNIQESVGEMYADSRKFKQIVYNLLSNAVKFTPAHGSVTLDASVITADSGKFLEVFVADTGIGMSEEGMKKLFRPFEQIDGSLSRKYEGTGLGLAMVKRLIELHGGTIEVESEEGKGSKFTFRIPYRENMSLEVEPPSIRYSEEKGQVASLGQPPQKKHEPLVLIVEDDPMSAELLSIQLESEGYRTIQAATALSGLELAGQEIPDLITLDIMLPDMHGLDFLKKMKETDEIRHIPVVIISMVSDKSEGFSLGASNVLQKPVSKDELIAAVRHLGILPEDTAKQLKVLVVDDDPKAVEIVSQYLQNEGCEVFKAYGGQEAVDTAKREMPDLIVLDLMMPEMTGFDVVRALKDVPETASIHIIILTAKIITEDDRRELNNNVLKIVQKGNFNKTDLIAEARRAMRTKIHDKAAAPVPVVEDITHKPLQPAVLVIEDDPAQSNMMRLSLERQGYTVMQAENGRAALELMGSRKPDIITLDLMMPEMDGFTFLEKKSENPDFADIPLVIVSAIAGESKGDTLSAGAFLRKPVRHKEMLSVVESLLGTAQKNKKHRILLIDDDPKAIKIIASYFTEDHYEVLKEYGGMEGIRSAAANRPDIIVLDLMMPEMNGFEVLRELKGSDATRDIPVVILTAKILTQEERQELLSGVETIFEKEPSSNESIIKNIELLLKTRK
ncbi:two-component system sensor histidine kinase [Candidatus Magnetominusculus xianensis]|uniref:histidine kinase n=2 Tax=Candidatus Magnetominusculus xianensis TaxID=1748249 RepID=A0ABR5SCX1_9BACT|nr:two-component system sensor histidine kinase [Candidatus Magnetominusculus xianensis]